MSSADIAIIGAGAAGMFCAMGVCQECVLLIDGQRREACRTSVAEGLEVRRISYE